MRYYIIYAKSALDDMLFATIEDGLFISAGRGKGDNEKSKA